MAVHACLIVTLAVLAAVPLRCFGTSLQEYCWTNNFKKIQTGLHFSKEVINAEYAAVGSFKAIHCCVKGYWSIEWFKDNRPYPWPGGESHFILYPESANQTIYTRSVKATDAGRYSCRARNDTTTVEGDITLSVLEDTKNNVYTGRPLPTYRPVSQLVPLGGSARLFCEAYLGKVNLPDAKNSVTWSIADSNATIPSYGRVAQYKVSRAQDQIVGSYLEIEDMTPDDYREYICKVSNGASENVILPAHIYQQETQFTLGLPNSSWRKSILIGVLGLLLLFSIGAFYARCRLPLMVLCRDKFCPVEENDGREYDALVCYHEKDSNLVASIVMPTLESIHLFKCTSLELSHVTQNWTREISPLAANARRIILILSPASLNNVWSDSNVGTVLKQLSYLSTRTIVVMLKDPPSATSLTKSSRRVIRQEERRDISDKLKILRWYDGGGNGTGGYNFWYKLRLAMPVVRRESSANSACQSVAMIVQVSSASKSGQQKARSRESLEVLV